MGLFDTIASSVLRSSLGQSELPPSEQQVLPSLLQQLFGRTDLGSLGGLLAMLQASGLDRQVASWLGTGTNLPVGKDQLRSALGDDRLDQLSSRAGVPQDQLLDILSKYLPSTIDRMSPQGTLQDAPAPASDETLANQAGYRDIKT